MDGFEKIKKSLSDAYAPFHGKDNKSITKNSTFDRAMLIQTVFVLINISTHFQILIEYEIENKYENIAETLAKKTETVISKYMNKCGSSDVLVSESPMVERKREEKHVLLIGSKGNDGKITKQS